MEDSRFQPITKLDLSTWIIHKHQVASCSMMGQNSSLLHLPVLCFDDRLKSSPLTQVSLKLCKKTSAKGEGRACKLVIIVKCVQFISRKNVSFTYFFSVVCMLQFLVNYYFPPPTTPWQMAITKHKMVSGTLAVNKQAFFVCFFTASS